MKVMEDRPIGFMSLGILRIPNFKHPYEVAILDNSIVYIIGPFPYVSSESAFRRAWANEFSSPEIMRRSTNEYAPYRYMVEYALSKLAHMAFTQAIEEL